MSAVDRGPGEAGSASSSPTAVGDDAIRVLLKRLARPDAAGGEVLERAALLAEGSEFPAIMAWITDHAGIPETAAVATSKQGLHGSRMNSGGGADAGPPRRYVLPAGTLA